MEPGILSPYLSAALSSGLSLLRMMPRSRLVAVRDPETRFAVPPQASEETRRTCESDCVGFVFMLGKMTAPGSQETHQTVHMLNARASCSELSVEAQLSRSEPRENLTSDLQSDRTQVKVPHNSGCHSNERIHARRPSA